MTTLLPSGACDCHTHVVGEESLYPMIDNRHYTPGPAPLDALLNHLKINGLERVVLIQPSFYGTNNLCMLDSLQKLKGRGRGIAVLPDEVQPDELTQLHNMGIRGIRINTESAGERDPKTLEKTLKTWADRICHLQWHIQLYVDYRTTAQIDLAINSLSVPVVLDHFAMVPANTAYDNAPFQSILNLLKQGNVFVKLSAAYRIANEDSVSAAKDLAESLIEANSARILWGSDWPHTNREPGKTAHQVSRYRNIPPASLRNSIDQWLPSPQLKHQVLVENPARLYGFPL